VKGEIGYVKEGGNDSDSASVKIKEVLRKVKWLQLSYLLFVVGFFFMRSSKWHNNLYYAMVLAPFLLSFKWIRLDAFVRSKTYVLSIAYLVFLYITLFWAQAHALSDFSKYGFRLLYVFVFLTVTIDLAQKYPDFLRRLFMCLCWAAAFAGCISILIYLKNYPVPDARLWNIGRAYHPNQAASVYCLVIIICYYGFLKGKKEKYHHVYWGMTAVMLAVVVLTKSRGPTLAIGITIFFCSLLGRNKRTVTLATVLFFLVGVWAIINVDILCNLFERGDSARLEIWRLSLERSSNAVWLGHGISVKSSLSLANGENVHHPHNLFAANLFYGGLVGTVFLMLLIGYALYCAFLHYQESKDPMLMAMIIFSVVCGLTDNDKLLCHPRPIWLFFWLPIALVSIKELSLRKVDIDWSISRKRKRHIAD